MAPLRTPSDPISTSPNGSRNGLDHHTGAGFRSSFWLPLVAAATGGIGAATLGVSAYAAYRLTRPRRFFGEGEPPSGGYEAVSFPSADGMVIRGWYLPSEAGSDAVILCHGFHTGRREMLGLALALNGRGHNVLMFDFRGHGESGGDCSTCGFQETMDLEGAVRYLQGRPEMQGGSIAVVGFSMGAAVAILTAARVPEISAVVADSSFASLRGVIETGFHAFYHLPAFPFASLSLWFAERMVGVRAEEIRPVDVIAEISPRPLLLIHGTEDGIVPVREAHLLYEAAGDPRELWIVEGANHVEARELRPEIHLDRVDAFLKQAVPRR